MALASRSARRDGAGRRWLLIGVVITLLVLFIDAALQSRSPGPGQQLAAGVWIDRVLPIVTTSTVEGQQIAAVWTAGLQTPAPSLSNQLDQIASGAAHAYQKVVALRPPISIAGAAGLLEACLLTRSQAATALRDALHPLLQGGVAPATTTTGSSSTTTGSSGIPGVDPIVSAIQTAGDDIQLSDRAYQLFIHSLPKPGVTMPPSVWAADPGPYQQSQAQVFLTSLQNAMSTTPVHQVKIYSVMTSPPPVTTQGGTQILPDASTMSVTVVIADVGNQPEKNLTVTASIVPGGSSASVRDFVDLTPGQAHTILGMGPLTPPQGVPVTLTIRVTPAAGSATLPLAQVLTFMMPSPTPSTTTTVPRGATTTLPG